MCSLLTSEFYTIVLSQRLVSRVFDTVILSFPNPNPSKFILKNVSAELSGSRSLKSYFTNSNKKVLQEGVWTVKSCRHYACQPSFLVLPFVCSLFTLFVYWNSARYSEGFSLLTRVHIWSLFVWRSIRILSILCLFSPSWARFDCLTKKDEDVLLKMWERWRYLYWRCEKMWERWRYL